MMKNSAEGIVQVSPNASSTYQPCVTLTDDHVHVSSVVWRLLAIVTSDMARLVAPVLSVWGAICWEIVKLNECATPKYVQLNVTGVHVLGLGSVPNTNLSIGPGESVGETPVEVAIVGLLPYVCEVGGLVCDVCEIGGLV